MFNTMQYGYESASSTLSQTQGQAIKESDASSKGKDAWRALQTLLERFAGGYSMDPLLKHSNKFFVELRNDEPARQWFRDFRDHTKYTFNYPESLNDESKNMEMVGLIDRGRMIFNQDRYRHRTDKIYMHGKGLLNGIKGDEITSALGESMRRLANDLVLDMHGKPSLWALYESLGQLKIMLLPVLSKQLELVRLPRIEGSSRKYDFAFDNLLFTGYDILPDFLQLSMDSKTTMDFQHLINQYAKANLKLKIMNIRVQLRDMEFFFRKKTFPRITDEGILDVNMLGAGCSMEVEWSVKSYGPDAPMRLKCKLAKCYIDNLDINIKQADHRFLDRLVLKLFRKRALRMMERSIADKLVDWGTLISDAINRAIASTNPSWQQAYKPLPATTGYRSTYGYPDAASMGFDLSGHPLYGSTSYYRRPAAGGYGYGGSAYGKRAGLASSDLYHSTKVDEVTALHHSGVKPGYAPVERPVGGVIAPDRR